MTRQFFGWYISITIVTTIFFSYMTIVLLQYSMHSENTPHTYNSLDTLAKNSSIYLLTKDLNQSGMREDDISKPFDTVLFVGDIMLARSVELWMQGEGMAYPFKHAATIFGSSTAVFANFEAAIPETHEHTVAYSTRFSTDEKYIAELARSGVTHLSLANNHAFDFGKVAEEHTRTTLKENGLQPFGNANTLGTTSITYVHTGSTTIGVLALQDVYGVLDETKVRDLMGKLRESSDIQIAFVHWGTEYQLSHDAKQKHTSRTSCISWGRCDYRSSPTCS